jgi:protoporphyrinogen/coproporphyrinogen III oxidase
MVLAARDQQVVVVGGGISGLAAARILAARPGVRVTVLEASSAVGGALRMGELAGVPVDDGAESFLARRPEATELARAVGLSEELTEPETFRASVLARRRLRPFPARSVLGIPADLRALAASGVLNSVEVARVWAERVMPAPSLTSDVSVGRFVASRLGRAVVDRLVDPLLGGVYAGRADELSLAATMPGLFALVREGSGLLAAARATQRSGTGGTPFGGIAGGLGRLPGAVVAASAIAVRTEWTARGLSRCPTGWRVMGDHHGQEQAIEAGAVIIAVPARAAADLLREQAWQASTILASIGYASVGLVTLAMPRSAMSRLPPGSGFLVPAEAGYQAKAVTVVTRKWRWSRQAWGDDVEVLRVSFGRYGQTEVLNRDDNDLIGLAVVELQQLIGLSARPEASRVVRWPRALPQYAVGHLETVAAIRSALTALPGVEICGAAYDGVGIPACVAGAQRAARAVLAGLADTGESAAGQGSRR